ncbi:MAG: NFACT family protein [Deltaproteobacteria bacterium]|nr:NFACT family protein [Deltaproteobacteria bacterium]
MSLSVEELADVVHELAALVGAVVQQAYAPRERVLLLELRVPGRTHLLRLDAEPGRTRMHLAGARPPSPAEPLAFQQQARAHLVGKKLAALELAPGDRVVSLRFADDEGERRVVAELTGRHGNLFLLAANGNLLALAGPNLSQVRALAPGRPYVPPASEPPAKTARSRFAPGPDFALSTQIEAAYAEKDRELDRAALRARIERPLRTKLERTQRTVKKVAVEAARGEAAEAHRVAGELLKSSLHQVKRGAREVALTDYSSGEPRQVTIALKPELSPADNLAWHFRQYRRLQQGAARAGERLVQLQREVEQLQQELASLAALDDDALRERALRVPEKLAPSRKGEPEARKPFREFRAEGGARILVGKGSAENDFLTFKVARPHDLWLHARGRKGAHVVVPLEKREQVKPEVLLDACALALHFSDAKGEPRAEVSYLPAKYLRKPRDAAPGQVIYSQEKTLVYVVEPERIARLLATAES